MLTYLRDLPEPTEEMTSNKTHVKLSLLQHSRENLGMPAPSPRGVSLDVFDELATTKRQCRHLLRRLFRVVSLSLPFLPFLLSVSLPHTPCFSSFPPLERPTEEEEVGGQVATPCTIRLKDRGGERSLSDS